MDLSTLNWPPAQFLKPMPVKKLDFKRTSVFSTYRLPSNIKKVEAEIKAINKINKELSPEEEKKQRERETPDVVKEAEAEERQKQLKRSSFVSSSQKGPVHKVKKKNSSVKDKKKKKKKKSGRTLFSS